MKKQCDNLAQSTLVASCGLLVGSMLTVAHAAPPAAKASRPMSASDVQETMQTRKAQVALARGRQLLRSGIDTLAEQQLRDAVRWAPRSIEAHRELARLFSSREQWPEAAAQWREIMRLSRGRAQTTSKYFVEAQGEWRRATGHLAAFWDTPNVVTLGADTRNPVVGHAGRHRVEVRSTAMLQPLSQRRVSFGRVLERQGAWVQRVTREATGNDGLRPYVEKVWQTAALFEPEVRLEKAKSKPLTRSERRTVLQTRTRRFVRVQWQESVLMSRRLPERQTARIALLRAQQLEAYGVETLAEQQLQQAVAVAPDWWEVQRAMARWQSRSQQWEAAVETWQKVLSEAEISRNSRLAGEAREQLQQAVAVAPDWWEVQRAMARWQSRSQQWEAAVETWQKVLSEAEASHNPRLAGEAKEQLQQARKSLRLGRLAQRWEQLNVVSLGADSRHQALRNGSLAGAQQMRQSMAMMRPPTSVAESSERQTVLSTGPKRFQFSFTLPGAVEAALAAQMRIESPPVSSTEEALSDESKAVVTKVVSDQISHSVATPKP